MYATVHEYKKLITIQSKLINKECHTLDEIRLVCLIVLRVGYKKAQSQTAQIKAA